MPFVPIADAEAFRKRVVLAQTVEDRTLEFKEAYRWQKEKWSAADRAGQAEELCRDLAQFANTQGGVLLVGITERRDGARTVADSVKPIDDVSGLKQWVEQAIRNHLVPATFSRSLREIVAPEGPILAINVLPSVHLVALWNEDGKKGIEYLYRTDHGKQWFNPDEVEKHIMNGSRAMQIRLADVLSELKAVPGNIPVALAPAARIWRRIGHAGGAFVPADVVTFDTSASTEHEIELRVGPICVRVPHGLVVEAWRTGDRKLGLCLRVCVTVSEDGSFVSLDPIAAA